MRIIGGELGGRRIAAPEGRGTRPMLDRVREALFNTLGAAVSDAFVLDLFSGSGSLGIEALSRGARHVRFVEKGAAAAKLLARNLAELGVEERTTLVRGDALAPASWGDEPAGVVLFDPPYPMLQRDRRGVIATVEELATGALAPGGILVFHAPKGAILDGEIPGTRRRVTAEVRHYGTNALWYVAARGGDDGSPGDSGAPKVGS